MLSSIVGVLVFILALVTFVYWLWPYIQAGYKGVPDAPTHVCPNCRSMMRPNIRRQGSGGVELLLWCFFIVPGVIYSAWRSSTRIRSCPACGARNPVPLNTPAGKTLTT